MVENAKRAVRTHPFSATVVSAAVGALVSVFIVVFAAGQFVGTVNTGVDRNCRVLVTILADVRFIAITEADEHTTKNTARHTDTANALREVFRNTAPETC